MNFRFILTYNGNDTTVTEPNGFTSFNSFIKRDFNAHGLFYRYIKGDLSLDFYDAGREVLESAYVAEGLDAQVTLTIDSREDEFSAWVNVFTGTSIMKTRDYTATYFGCDFEEVNALSKIMSRKDEEYDTDKARTLDGVAMSPPSFTSLNYQPKAILAKTGTLFEINGAGYTTSGGSGIWAQNLGTIVAKGGANEIEFTNGDKADYNTGAVDTTDGVQDDVILLNAGAEMDVDPVIGDYSFIINVRGNWTLDSASSSSGVLVQLQIKEYTVDSDGVATLASTTTVTESLLQESVTTEATFNVDEGSFTVSTSKKRYVLALNVQPSRGSETASFTISGEATLEVQWDSLYPSSTILALHIHETLKKNLEYITSETNFLYSEVFGRTENGYATDGILSDMLETNGFLIRRFNRGIIGSLETRLESLNAIFSIGHGIQYDDYTKSSYQYRVEPTEYWYKDSELLVIADYEIDSYSEEFATDLEFNQIRIGYKDYAKDEDLSASLYDFNTEHGYSLPLEYLVPRNDSGEPIIFGLISEYIASDYLWEVTRRVQFEQEPNKTSNLDEDLFIVQVKNDYPNYTQLTVADAIENVTGLENSATSFNFLLNPRYNFYNHSRVINSVLFRKPLSDDIYNTYARVNKDFSFNYQAGYDAVLGDTTKRLASMSDDMRIDEYGQGLRLFEPVFISFKTGLTQAEVNNLIDAHQNGASSANYGYITITNPDGDTVTGWLMELTYNPIDRIASFTLIKRATNYV